MDDLVAKNKDLVSVFTKFAPLMRQELGVELCMRMASHLQEVNGELVRLSAENKLLRDMKAPHENANS